MLLTKDLPKTRPFAPNQAFNFYTTLQPNMSEKKTNNLTDFFKKENKKKPAPKKDNASSEQTKAQAEIANEPTKEKLPKKDDYESSEEEKTDLIIGQDQANLIKDKKEIQAQKRKQ